MQMFGLGWAGGTGTAHINGGTLNLHQLHPTQSIMPGSVLDIAGGTVIITGDRTADINNYIATNAITADGGSGTVSVTFNAGLNATVLTDGKSNSGPPQNITSITTDNLGDVTINYVTQPRLHVSHVQSTASLEPAPISWTDVPGSTTNSVTGSAVSFTYLVPSGTGALYFRTVSP